MKIAVTYEGGSIFQHFGKTETFKMYEVEDGKMRQSMHILQENWNLPELIVTIITKKDIPAVDIMRKKQKKLRKKNIPVADTAVDAADVAAHMYRILKVRMWERPAVLITEELLTMEPSSTHPMTAANRWSLYAVQVR